MPIQIQQHNEQGFPAERPLQQTGGKMNKHIKKEHPRKTAKTPRGQKTALETSEIAHQNKDISSKVVAEYFNGKTFKVYGLDLPEISNVGPTNIPAVKANELRLDNLFELADHSVAIVDYESKYKKEDKIKYLNYLTGIANRYQNEKKTCPPLRMIVIYTGDVRRSQVTATCDFGAIKMRIEPAFLSELDGDSIFNKLKQTVHSGQLLTDEELMEFMILPLSFRKKEEKLQKIQEVAKIAEMIADYEQQLFVMAGLLTFADKIIDYATANKIKEKINMNKVEWLIRQDIRKEYDQLLQTTKQAAEQAAKQAAEQAAEQAMKQAEQQFKKEREQDRQQYEQKLNHLVKWISDQGYSTDEILSHIL